MERRAGNRKVRGMQEWKEQGSQGLIKEPGKSPPGCPQGYGTGGGVGRAGTSGGSRRAWEEVGGTSGIAAPVGTKSSSSHGDGDCGVTTEQEHIGWVFYIHA